MALIKKAKNTKNSHEVLSGILNILSSRRRDILTGLILFSIAAAVSAVIPYIYGRITDLAIAGGGEQIKQAGALLALWLGLSLFNTLLRRSGQIISYKTAINVSNEFIVSSLGSVLRLPMSFHKEHKMGSISRRIIDAGDRGLFVVIEDVLFDIIPNLVSFVIAFTIVFFVEWRLALVLMVASVVYAVATFIWISRLLKFQKISRQSWQKTYGFFFDALNNIHNIKLTGNETHETERVNRHFNKSGRREIKLYGQGWQALYAFQSVIFDLSFVAVFGLGVWLLGRGEFTAGRLIMFIGYTNLLTSPLSRLARQYQQIRNAFVDIGLALELLKKKPEPLEIGHPISIIGRVEFNHIVFAYDKNKKPVLNGISFTAEPGESIALVGKSGVGKTTLADLIGRYFEPQSGTILLDGFPLSKINLLSLRNQMAVVPQEVSLFNDTIFNNIRYTQPSASKEKITAAARAANAEEFIKTFPKKYNQIVGERGVKLSTGQKQRVAIARAMLRDPKILILDEATSALDSESERLVQEALTRLVKGRTTFIIAHRLSTIKNADKIIVLENGRVAEMGKHAELMKNSSGIYRNFWELQSARQNI